MDKGHYCESRRHFDLCCCDWVYEQNSSSEVYNNSKPFHRCYLSQWNFSSQVYFMLLSSFDELVTFYAGPGKVRNAFNFIAMLFPLSVLIILLFWFLHVIHGKLVFKNLNGGYSSWMVFSVHSFIILPLPGNIYPLEEQQSKVIDFYYVLPIPTVFIEAYRLMLLWVYLLYDWLYRIFRHFVWWQRLLFVCFLYCSSVLFLILGMSLQQWRQTIKIIILRNFR